MQLKQIRVCVALSLVCTLTACNDDNPGPSGAGGNAAAAGGNGGAAGTGPQAAEIAQWPMPNSPGLGLPNPQDYDASSTPGVVHDLVTGLDWLQAPGVELYSRLDALAQCEQLSFASFDDWRAPTFIELVSLFDVVPNEQDPLAPLYISPIFRAEGRFWSSSAVSNKGLGRLLDFTADGCSATTTCSIGVAAKATDPLGGAFCVRSATQPSTQPRYEITGNGVEDLRTGLTWLSVPANIQTGGYADAVGACNQLGAGARLPSITELLSLLVPVLDSRAFPNWPNDAFAWSSSTVPAKPGSHWVAAIAGATRAEDDAAHDRIECVR